MSGSTARLVGGSNVPDAGAVAPGGYRISTGVVTFTIRRRPGGRSGTKAGTSAVSLLGIGLLVWMGTKGVWARAETSASMDRFAFEMVRSAGRELSSGCFSRNWAPLAGG